MISNILNNHALMSYFQPIVSIRSGKVVGVEALMRVFDEQNELLSPIFLFEQAKKEELSFELDHRARTTSLHTFKELFKKNESMLLFLNFESYLLDKTNVDIKSFGFCELAKEFGILPARIVIEIKEYQIHNTQRLCDFCDYYKKCGFLIALDDFGSGNANFDRISSVRPHIVKIDRSIVFNMHRNFIHKEVLKSIAHMCFNIGALVLAEGVESEEEILKALKIDVDLFQGYWFAKPSASIYSEHELNAKIREIGTKHAQNVKASMQYKSLLIEMAKSYASTIINAIQKDKYADLEVFLNAHTSIEAIYCIDAKTGIQEGKTFIETHPNAFFNPAQEGDNHSLKEYVYITQESRRGNYLSQKYISRASGQMCRTFAQKFICNGEEKILCLDLKATMLPRTSPA